MKEVVPNNAKLIPASATRVFQGKIFGVYQWQQKMYDGSEKTFEMLKRPDTVEIIAIKNNKVVVLEEEQPDSPHSYYALPGGRHDIPGESTLLAAKRELLEEAGLAFSTWRLINVVQPLTKSEWFIYQYLATDLENEIVHKPELDGEKIIVMEKTIEEIKALLQSPKRGHLPADLFNTVNSIEDLTNMPEFRGQEVDRT